MIRRRTALIGGGAAAAGLAALLWRRGAGAGGGARVHPENVSGFRALQPEGAEVILDPALYPTTFREAPMLAERVRAGELPPVAERIGLDPIVVRPLHEIGRYGGTIRRAFLGPDDTQGIGRFGSGPDSLLYWDHAWQAIRPNIARAFAFSRDDRVLTLSLRRGMRWSDGAPFNADDVMFWYERMYMDRRVIGARSVALLVDGQDVVIRKLDDLTLEFVSPSPYPMLADMLASYTEISGPAGFGRNGMGGYAPRHYLEQFHPDFRSEAALIKEAREAGFANWAIRLKARNEWTLNPELPVICPWRVTSPINTQALTLERNPYSVWVDTAGNQLPYVDRIEHVLCSGGDGVAFKTSAGKLDFQERHLYISKLPFLLSNRGRSNYKVHLDPFLGTDLGVRVNLGHRRDAEIGELLRSADFRRALSLGIDRHQVNETFLFGTGLPSAATPAPDCKYYPGDAWARRWAAYDPAEANRMLDTLGLARRDDDGFRLRRDGGGRLRLICTTARAFFDFVSLGEMIREQWRDIGIDMDLQLIEGTLWLQRAMSGEMQITLQSAGAEDPFTFPDFLFPSSPFASGAVMGVEFARWFRSNGEVGEEPPPEIREMMELWRRGRAAAPEERLELGRELIRRHVDLALSIGLISGGLANYGVHIASNDLGNVPRRILNTSILRSPANVLPMTFYFRTPDRRQT